MQTAELIQLLSRPEAYPFGVDKIEVCQTHLSVVFLAGPFAYKVLKPVVLPFVDLGTLPKRRQVCDHEVRLNRRLAPDVYLGVVSVGQTESGIQMERGSGIEWAIKMDRLPGEATLEQLLQRDELSSELLGKLAGKLAAFHSAAESSERITSFGRTQIVAANLRDTQKDAQQQTGVLLDKDLLRRVSELTEDALHKLGPLIHARALRHVPCDTHGDLRLEHVYHLPARAPDGLVIIDCIAFNDLFRYADPVSDVAFLVMDLLFHGRRDLAESFGSAYLEAARDAEARPLLPFYSAYRACVRAKVEGMKAQESEVPEEERSRASQRCQSYWKLAEEQLRQTMDKLG